jgi:hypothetical protein
MASPDRFGLLPCVAAASALVVAIACGSTGRIDPPGTTPSSPGDGDGGAPAPGAYETEGIYRCCGPDAGTSCCAGTAQGTCFEYGGTYKGCRKAGEQYEGKVNCARCCPGLTRVNILELGDKLPPATDQLPEGCDLGAASISIGVCIACGDGVCGVAESFCNCPEDCPRP